MATDFYFTLGKANLSALNQFISPNIPRGWSQIGGQCSSAYYLKGDPSGSSSGSAVAVSIGLVTIALGTDTNGSITCPSSNNNLVGIRPTVGLTSRKGGN